MNIELSNAYKVIELTENYRINVKFLIEYGIIE